jgi:UDP-N-acetylglucosamine acyltransferase
MVTEGNPSNVRGVNVVGLSRRGFSPETLNHLKDAWKRMYRRRAMGGAGSTASALEDLEDAYPHDACILGLVAAVRRAMNGSHGRYREAMRKDKVRLNPAK